MQQSQIFCLCQPAKYRFHKSLHIKTHADAGGAFSCENAPLLLEVDSNHTNNKEAHYENR